MNITLCDNAVNVVLVGPAGLAALKLPEQPTVAAASSFFVAFIGLSTTMGPVSEVLQLNGKVLVQYVLQAIAWAAPRSYVVSFSDIINSLLVNCITLLSQWLEVCAFVHV